MFRIYIALVFFIFVFFKSFSQKDTVLQHATIKVSKPKDTIYIIAYTNFYVYFNKPNTDLSYKDYILQMQQKSIKAATSNRLLITDAKPKKDTARQFNYTAYFKNNHFTKDIKMRKNESDTVNLLVFVSNKGEVKYFDLSTVEKKGNSYIVYNNSKSEYKEDVCHIKTRNAFNELINDNWQPAIISTLKKHPSKKKKKYNVSKGYSEGILTIIYSSDQLEN